VLPELPDLFEAAVEAVMPQTMIPAVMHLDDGVLHIDGESFDLERYHRLFLCGAGKASLPMAEACEMILGKHIDGGVIVSPEDERPLRYCSYVHSTHPIPSQESVAAADRMIEQFDAASQEDLILFLLSGGSSALLEKPIAPVSLEDMALTTKLLLENGCSIEETNAVRKHLSLIKGGRLARLTKARVVVLVVSDVIGDEFATIGSGPLYCDPSTYEAAAELVQEKGIADRLPKRVRSLLDAGAHGRIGETPKTLSPQVTHLLLGSNRRALEAAAESAIEHGRDVRLKKAPLHGDVAAAAEEFCRAFDALPPGRVLLLGGETTVTVGGNGRGGRNQHFALLCLQRLKTNFVYDMICAGTDGIDGNSEAAGARISDALYRRCTPQEIEGALEQFDSNTFFASKKALIETGYTGTNVMDIVIAYKGEDNG
jgi:glycerate 2-kinase